MCIRSPRVYLAVVCTFLPTRELAKSPTKLLKRLGKETHHLCVGPLFGPIACPYAAHRHPYFTDIRLSVFKCKLPATPSPTAQRSQRVAPKQSGASAQLLPSKSKLRLRKLQLRKRSSGLSNLEKMVIQY